MTRMIPVAQRVQFRPRNNYGTSCYRYGSLVGAHCQIPCMFFGVSGLSRLLEFGFPDSLQLCGCGASASRD